MTDVDGPRLGGIAISSHTALSMALSMQVAIPCPSGSEHSEYAEWKSTAIAAAARQMPSGGIHNLIRALMSEWYTPSAGAWTLHMQRELGSTTLAAVRVVRHAPCRDMDTGWRCQKPYVSDLAAVSSQSEPNGIETTRHFVAQ
jgi:hypothetical protein